MNKVDQAVNHIADTAQDATDKLATKAVRTVDTARDLANDALDKADAKVRTLREDIKPAIDAVAWRVQDAAHRCREVAADTTAQAREKARQCADKTTAYVQEQPLKSMAMAAAAGAVLALLLGRRR